MKQFCDELRSFNKVHRLVGNVSCETLLAESATAIANSEVLVGDFDTMIDVGAGAGILGYAWMHSRLNRRCVFLEPDPKAVAFLRSFFGGEPNAAVINGRIERAGQYNLAGLFANPTKIFLATRAFSSSRSLQELYTESGLDVPLFSFEKSDGKFFLAKKF